MTLYVATAAEPSAVSTSLEHALRPSPSHEHDWRLRDVEEVNGDQIRRFECDGCDGVSFL